jgi:hypothetical protein
MKREQQVRHVYTSSFIENVSCIVPIPRGADERYRFLQVGEQSRDFPKPVEQPALSPRPLSSQSLKLALIGSIRRCSGQACFFELRRLVYYCKLLSYTTLHQFMPSQIGFVFSTSFPCPMNAELLTAKLALFGFVFVGPAGR